MFVLLKVRVTGQTEVVAPTVVIITVLTPSSHKVVIIVLQKQVMVISHPRRKLRDHEVYITYYHFRYKASDTA